MRFLKPSHTHSASAGEGALDVAEQFGFEQILGNGAAVDGDQRPAGAARRHVNGARGQFLARTCLAGHQHCAAPRANQTNHLGDVAHCLAVAHQIFAPRLFGDSRGDPLWMAQPLEVDRCFESELDRLCLLPGVQNIRSEVLGRAEFHAAHGFGNRPLAIADQDRRPGIQTGDLLKHAFRRIVRQRRADNRRVEAVQREQSQPLLPRQRPPHAEPVER